MKLYLLIAVFLLNIINREVTTSLNYMYEHPVKTCKLDVIKSQITDRNLYLNSIEIYTEFNATCETSNRFLVVTRKCHDEKCIDDVMNSYYNPPTIAYELENGQISLEKPLMREFLYNIICVSTKMAMTVLGIWILCT